MQKMVSFMKMPVRRAPADSGSGDMARAFHGDRCYQQLVLSICSHFPITSFVETGTYLGDTTEYMANTVTLPIYTSEVNERFFQFAVERLKRYGNVKASLASSEQVLRLAIEQNLLGPLPLFYLDAHWYDYWPLPDEIELISSRVPRCVIVIDDFEVPGHPEFEFCEGGGGSSEFSGRTTVDKRICNFELIQDKLGHPEGYQLIYPRYAREEAFSIPDGGKLIGYVALFKNLGPEFVSWTKQPFIGSHFSAVHLG
jgi:hypothetical protein